MTRKSFAGALALAILLAGGIFGPRFLSEPVPGSVRGLMIANSHAEGDRQRREAALHAAVLDQRREQERKVAAARHEQELKREAEQQAQVLKQEEEDRLADAFNWAERYQQRREIAEKEAVRKQQEERAWTEARAESEQDRQQREASEALVRKHRHDEQRMIAEARAKAEGVQLGQKGSGPSSNATGTISPCTNCDPNVNGRRTGARARPGRNVAHVRPSRARPVRTASGGCSMLAWLQTGY